MRPMRRSDKSRTATRSALAPGSLFLWHLLGLFGTDPTKLHRMFLLLKSFMPPDQKVQEILDSTMANVVVTGSSGLLANAGIILGIYFGTVFIATTSRALSHTYGMREDPHWWSKYIISFFMLFWFGIVIVFCLAPTSVIICIRRSSRPAGLCMIVSAA